ncbi:hypothetical protein ACOJIU_11915 [Carnobacterium maltaromaticum]|uniref:beta-sandwich lipoprotein n=1 Tax=Carnobacterium maltaromaticum TaxID=2751 RepID=UPI0012FAB004|nr:hypothetical protein [Carnobacterium maltaromaticum]
MKKLLAVMALVVVFGLAGCRQSDKISYNVSKEADNFNVIRRVAVINTRTDKIEFEVIGKISVDSSDESKLVILAETDKNVYKKHLVNLTEWNMYIVEDLEGAAVNQYKYEVNYMPESIVPFTITESK